MTSGWPAATQLRVSGTLDLDPESPAFTKAPVKALVVTVGASSRVKQEALSRVADVLVHGDDKLHAGVMLDAFAKRASDKYSAKAETDAVWDTSRRRSRRRVVPHHQSVDRRR
jgi:hypothetical protein